MFQVRRGKRPADTPFVHEPGCKTSDSAPEWHKSSPDVWERVCSCATQRAHVVGVDGVDPNSEAARPAAGAHQHSPGCGGEAVPQVVQIERRDGGGWLSTCGLCATHSYFFWTPEYRVRRGGVEVEADHDGLFWRRYELERPVVEPDRPAAAPSEPAPRAGRPLFVAGRRAS